MPRFSNKSNERLSTCNGKLQEIAKEAIKQVDFTVLCGHRIKSTQDRFFKEGFSRVNWPMSKHNSWPSRAFDLAPWPIDWEDRERFFFLAGVIMTIASGKKIRVRWGGAWSGQFNREGDFDDLGHFELVE